MPGFEPGPPLIPIVPKLPLGPLGVIIGIVQFIMNLLGFGSIDLRPIEKAINNTWANLAVGAAFLYNTLGAIYDFLKKLFKIVYDALKHIISDVLHGHLRDLLHDIQGLFKQLRQLFGPIIDFLTRLRMWYYKYIYPWIRLVQQILSTVRVILSAFRLLGAKWAAKLDADIQKIQGYITAFTSAIVSTLNAATTWLNFITDPLGLMRKSFFQNSMLGNLKTVFNSVNFGKDRYLSASEAANNDGDRAMAGGGAAILTRNSDGSVTYSDASQRINDAGIKEWNAYGNPKA